MLIHKTLPSHAFPNRANALSSTVRIAGWEFVMGVLSRFLPRRFAVAGYPIVAIQQQYSTARINTAAFQSQIHVPQNLGATPQKSRTLQFKPYAKMSLFALVLILVGGSNFSSIPAPSPSFSNQQIDSYIKVVTLELEQSPNQIAQLGNFNQAKLSCSSVLLGEGERGGNRGIYTWFTCSGLHSALVPNPAKASFSCTGFSSAVWIQPSATSVNYAPVTNTSQYISLRNSAPEVVQQKLDQSYNLVHLHSYDQVVGRAIQSVKIANQPTCS
jgi:hypothetical protein